MKCDLTHRQYNGTSGYMFGRPFDPVHPRFTRFYASRNNGYPHPAHCRHPNGFGGSLVHEGGDAR